MTLEQIKEAVRSGKKVLADNGNAIVRCYKSEQWLIDYYNSYNTGLTWADGKTLHRNDFYIVGKSPANMTLEQIKEAVRSGQTVLADNGNAIVRCYKSEQWLIDYYNSYNTGLTWADGKTLHRNDFYIAKQGE